MKGSPKYPCGQIHIAEWLTTRHSAFVPHAFIQGSLHFCLMHARCGAHSLLLIHSGLQYGGCPLYSSLHVQDGLLFLTSQIELGPQGDG